MGLLRIIRKGIENKPENLNMLGINPQRVYILNIAYKVGLNSPYIAERKKTAENGIEDDQKPSSVSI